MNLRLQPSVADALRAESERTGRPQQQIIREAVEQYLAVAPSPSRSRMSTSDVAVVGLIKPARRPFGATTVPPLTLRAGETTADLLDRDDRI